MSVLLLSTEASPVVPDEPRSPLLSLDRQYWTFFSAAFFFDAGFAIYFFLFNLYLLDAHWNERLIGLVGGAFTLGSVLTILPAGEMVRRVGVRKLLLACFISAPLFGIVRILWLGTYAQIFCAILAGAAMSLWGVSYLPAVARIVPPQRRAAAYSLIFSASLITSAVGTVLCGSLPGWITGLGFAVSPLRFKRGVLLSSCLVAMLGIMPLLRLRVSAAEQIDSTPQVRVSGWHLHSFQRRLLACMALWALVIAPFTPFANVYLAHERHVPLRTISLVFALIQVMQLALGLTLPYLVHMLGLRRGLLLIQLAAAFALGTLALTPTNPLFWTAYVGFSAMQWMSFPALYSTLMNNTPENQHHCAAAIIMFLNALLGAIATPLAGEAFVRYGYRSVLLITAAIASGTALLFYRCVASADSHNDALPR